MTLPFTNSLRDSCITPSIWHKPLYISIPSILLGGLINKSMPISIFYIIFTVNVLYMIHVCISACLYIESPSQNYSIIATELDIWKIMIKVNLTHDNL